MALETHANYRDGTGAHPGEARLAEMCNLQERAVRYALEKGQSLGLIRRTSTSNRRRGLADVYRLVFSANITGTVMPVNGVITGMAVPVNAAITGTVMHDHRHGDNRITGMAVPPNLPERSLEQGESRKAGTAPAPTTAASPPPPISLEVEQPPSRFCARHPNNTNERCPRCGEARERHEAWWRREIERRTAANDARRREIDKCRHGCAPHGRVEETDADGNEVLVPCPAGHPKPVTTAVAS